jgi:hypothetical protein
MAEIQEQLADDCGTDLVIEDHLAQVDARRLIASLASVPCCSSTARSSQKTKP